MEAAQAAEKLENRWSLTWYLRLGIFTSVTTWTHSQNFKATVEVLKQYFLMKHLLDDHEDHPSQEENNQNLCNEKHRSKGISPLDFVGKSMETKTT